MLRDDQTPAGKNWPHSSCNRAIGMQWLWWPASAQWRSWRRAAVKLVQRPDYDHELPDPGVSRNDAHDALERKRRRGQNDADRTGT